MATPKTRASQRKIRRWGFEAQITWPAHDVTRTNEVDGKEVEETVHVDERNVRMGTGKLTIGTLAQAKQACRDQESELAQMEPMKNATIKVHPIGYETVSLEMMRQVHGYRDMAKILDRALEITLREAKALVDEKDVVAAKEEAYKRALATLEEESKPQEDTNQIVLTDGE